MEAPKNNEALILELENKLKDIMTDESRSDEIMEAISEHAAKIRKEYKDDHYKYRLWHVLVSSTPSEQIPIAGFDFPGDLSVEQFIKSL